MTTETSNDFSPRSYQQELFEHALKQNSILVSGTGSGKTFIAIMLIKELGAKIRGTLTSGAKRTVYIVNTVPLVYQQAEAIVRHTPFKVAKFEGSMDVDSWTSEKWQNELDAHEVLVMVAEVGHMLILSNRLPVQKINLLIIDECHHASGHHPMSKIMSEYKNFKQTLAPPRILGLTACAINGKCNPGKVKVTMENLESTMDSRLVTSKFQDVVKLHSTKPAEIIESYDAAAVVSDTYQLIYDKLSQLTKEVNKQIDSDFNKLMKFFKKTTVEILSCINEIGNYVARDIITSEAEYLRKAETNSLAEQNLYTLFADGLYKILLDLPEIKKACAMMHLSEKFKALRRILLEHAKSDINLRIIVFVEKRNTAKYLHKLMLELKYEFGLKHLKPESIVGGTANTKYDLKVDQNIENQRKVLTKFQKGDCNIIFSTSVLEEGIDVQKCNLVIRFDKPKCFSSYFQSLGRARAKSSKFILLTSKTERFSLIREINEFASIKKEFTELCCSRSLVNLEAGPEDIGSCTGLEYYAPFGLDGPRITLDSSIQLLNKYCGSLPQDKFAQLSVTVEVKEVMNGFEVTLNLPRTSPMQDSMTGDWKRNKTLAKKSAALKLCIKLHEIEELTNEHLLPKKLKHDFHFRNLLINYEEVEEGMPKPGSKKRQQIYRRQVCNQFQDSANRSCLNLHSIEFEDTNGSFRNNERVGILSAESLECCKFTLDCLRHGKIETKVHLIKELQIDSETRGKIEHFHEVTYKLLLNLEDVKFKKGYRGILIVPLLPDGTINLNLLDSILELPLSNNAVEFKQRADSVMVGGSRKYEDTVLIPTYKEPKFLMVKEIIPYMNPLSPFPENKREFSSYKDYYKKKYNIDINDCNQPLLKCKNFPKELNYIRAKKERSHNVYETESVPQLYIPELCSMLPFSASLWWQIKMVPSALHRINALMLERQIFKNINTSFYIPGIARYFVDGELDINWSKFELEKNTSDESNLVVSLNTKSDFSIYPGMILQALTSNSANDVFNLERLEVMGDSYLKFAVSDYLFYKEKRHHEGKLTMERSQIVSNKTLYTLAKNKDIPAFYQGFVLDHATIYPFGLEKIGENCLREESNFNPREEQAIRDKDIADCVESLTGVYLLAGGEAAARHFLTWLGFDFLNEDQEPLLTAVMGTNVALHEIQELYQRYCLDELEKIIQYEFNDASFLIQAVTHPSDTRNKKITDCYQRLEFLGDAVLDYLITGYIFARYNSYSPGKLTDMRSYLVNNETLGRSTVKSGIHRYLQHESLKLNTCIDIFIDRVAEGETELNTEDDAEEIKDVEVPKALGDMFEAILGAVYIDSRKSLTKCWKIVESLLAEELTKTEREIPINHVREFYETTALKNINVRMDFKSPTESELAKCIIYMEGFPPVTGNGKSKRTAKQSAARIGLKLICS